MDNGDSQMAHLAERLDALRQIQGRTEEEGFEPPSEFPR